MLLKVLIVDDEVLVRNDLRTLIDWESQGFFMCGEANNGANAIHMIEKLTPSIVIFDINMPVLDGVALSKYISEHFKHIKMIIISSYDNYDYVRETMKNGAIDYLLKHRINSTTLIAALEKAKMELLNEEREKVENERNEKKWGELGPVAQQKYVKEFLLGINENVQEVYEYFDMIEFKIKNRSFIVVVMQISNFLVLTEKYSDKEKSLLFRAVIDLSNQVLEEPIQGIVIHIDEGRFAIILSFNSIRSENNLNTIIHSILDKIAENIKRYIGIKVILGTSEPYFNFVDLPKAYRQARKRPEELLADLGNGEGNNSIPIVTLTIGQEKNLLAALENINYDDASEVINQIFIELNKSGNNPKAIQFCINELINIAYRAALKLKIDSEYINDLESSLRDRLNKSGTVGEMSKSINELYFKLIDSINKNKIKHYSKYVEKTMQYIQNNYYQQISLDEAAKAIAINSSYLSHIFKEELGKGFSEYLNYIRVQAAKKLILKDSMTVKSIYSEVGFNNYNYFFKVFKDIEGITPVEFSKKHMS